MIFDVCFPKAARFYVAACFRLLHSIIGSGVCDRLLSQRNNKDIHLPHSRSSLLHRHPSYPLVRLRKIITPFSQMPLYPPKTEVKACQTPGNLLQAPPPLHLRILSFLHQELQSQSRLTLFNNCLQLHPSSSVSTAFMHCIHFADGNEEHDSRGGEDVPEENEHA